ncbi:hypothetical protein DPMN_038239 [Dreissena polymorpha]|uniref:Uncharacterized protein n=1 Tax=Dreissena polymorpha TaxID=45954 RepID=A0A9D4RN03_DREPO|nr:hypothetical protein DPMN_038239 [Dreissena polymorpha]
MFSKTCEIQPVLDTAFVSVNGDCDHRFDSVLNDRMVYDDVSQSNCKLKRNVIRDVDVRDMVLETSDRSLEKGRQLSVIRHWRVS